LLKGADIMSLERAILLFVGATVLVTVLLGVYHSLNWLWITGLLGAHLVQASFTGFCPVVRALKSMGYQSKPSFT
jgi:Flp pilus assembly protein TadB